MLFTGGNQSNQLCELDWIEFKSKCYYLALADLNAFDAKQDCGSRNSSLATPNDKSVNQFLVQSIRSQKQVDFWIGLVKSTSNIDGKNCTLLAKHRLYF